MEQLIGDLFNSNTVISLITSATAFYSSYKLLEAKVKQQWEEIKELRNQIKDIDIIDLKTQLAEIKTNLNWLIEEIKKKS